MQTRTPPPLNSYQLGVLPLDSSQVYSYYIYKNFKRVHIIADIPAYTYLSWIGAHSECIESFILLLFVFLFRNVRAILIIYKLENVKESSKDLGGWRSQQVLFCFPTLKKLWINGISDKWTKKDNSVVQRL